MTGLVQHISYQSPYGGHMITRRKSRDAIAAISAFLENCTDWDGRRDGAKACVSPADKYLPPTWTGDELAQTLEERLGRPKGGVIFSEFKIGEGVWTPGDDEAPGDLISTNYATQERVWDIPDDLYDWALDLVLDQPVTPRDHPDCADLNWGAEFRLRSPGTGEVLADQSLRSSIMPTLAAGKCSSFFDLFFPFDEPTDEFVDFVAAIRPYLPFRLAKGNFRVCIPTKSGHEYRVRKIDKAIFSEI